jgi:hypothetical protein
MDIEALPSRHWERKAREAHDKANSMTNAEARKLMRVVVRRYRQMATIASKRKAEPAGRPSARSDP